MACFITVGRKLPCDYVDFKGKNCRLELNLIDEKNQLLASARIATFDTCGSTLLMVYGNDATKSMLKDAIYSVTGKVVYIGELNSFDEFLEGAMGVFAVVVDALGKSGRFVK